MRPSQRLLRSAIDATRFTATAPHAYTLRSTAVAAASSNTQSSPSRSSQRRDGNASSSNLKPLSSSASRPPPSSSSSSSSFSHNPPPPPPSSPGSRGNNASGAATETPAQKVARLRAEHARQRIPKLSAWEKVVLKGRSIADAAHFFVAVSLMGITAIAAVLAIYSVTDMIIFNRKKRNAYFAEQAQLLTQRTDEAALAARKGIASAEQMELLAEQRAALLEREEREEKMKKRSPWEMMKRAFSTEGLKVEEGGAVGRKDAGTSAKIGAAVVETGREIGARAERTVDELKREERRVDQGVRNALPGQGWTNGGTLEESGKIPAAKGGWAAAVERERRAGEREMQARDVEGGMLDRMAGEVVGKAENEGKSWSSWLGWR
ncbi:hypothetical protein MMC25_004459 [Agyrium rufum]|nr:hypothetical protein [Agyrium rufum]